MIETSDLVPLADIQIGIRPRSTADSGNDRSPTVRGARHKQHRRKQHIFDFHPGHNEGVSHILYRITSIAKIPANFSTCGKFPRHHNRTGHTIARAFHVRQNDPEYPGSRPSADSRARRRTRRQLLPTPPRKAPSSTVTTQRNLRPTSCSSSWSSGLAKRRS